MSTSDLLITPTPSTQGSTARDFELNLRILPASARAEAMFLWRKLELALASQQLTSSSVWTETWLDHYGMLIPHHFAVGTREGSPCGIALVTEGVAQKAGPFSLSTRHLGTAGEPESDSVCIEYNSLLAAPDDQAPFLLALWNWMHRSSRCDEIRLDGFEASTLEALTTGNSRIQIVRRPSHYYDLEPLRGTTDEPLARLGSHTRANIRRTLRELKETRGVWSETASQAEKLFHQMVVLHQARWNGVGKPGVYSSRRFHDFHLDLLHRAVPLGLMTMFGVTAGDRLIGCNQLLIDNRRVLLYQCGRAEAAQQRVSYGIALDYFAICEARHRGFDAVDFLAGTGEHKRRLSTNQAEVAWVVWRRPNLKNFAIDTLRRLKRSSTKPEHTSQSSPVEE